jgi:acetyl esterase/lipase
VVSMGYNRELTQIVSERMKMKHLGESLVIGVLLFCCGIPSQGAESFLRTEDVVYGRKFGLALTMDVFQPAEANGCGLLFLVNGGWLSSKATPRMVTIQPDDYVVYLGRGYTVFAVVTSSQPKFTISDEIEDVQRAVRFVRANASRFGVRPDRLGVLGSSSGGHLTLSAAARGGPGNPASDDPVERESSALQAVVCFFPPTDFLNYGGPGISGVGEGPLAPLRVAFGPNALTAEGRAVLGREISPIYYVTSNLPPTLIIHGDADEVVPLQQSESFVHRAQEVGAEHVKLIVRQGKGHGWGDFWRSTEDIAAFADWFDAHLKIAK